MIMFLLSFPPGVIFLHLHVRLLNCQIKFHYGTACSKPANKLKPSTSSQVEKSNLKGQFTVTARTCWLFLGKDKIQFDMLAEQ